MVHHHGMVEPGAPFWQAGFPKIRRQADRTGRLLEGRAEGLQKGIGVGDNIESKLAVLEVPGCSAGPGGVFVIPETPDASEIIIAQLLDARRKMGGRFDEIARFLDFNSSHGSLL
jgi:hypothetical protein